MPKIKSKIKRLPEAKTYTVEQLIDQANVALSTMQLELAEKMFCRALSIKPNDTNIMDALADVYIQMGEMDNALQLLLRSTTNAPNENPFKWMFLGQLQTGPESIESYKTGIEILSKVLDVEDNVIASSLSVADKLDNACISLTQTATADTIRKQIAKAHCSIAEIFLTDLCFEECAESNCETEVQKALAICPDSLDGLQTLASLRLSQNRRPEATVAIDRVLQQVTRIRDVIRARTVIEEISGAEEPAEFDDVPEMEFCIATAKILVECAAEDPHFANKAMDLVSDLLQDDDENIELWYLMGVAALSCAPPDADCARYNLERAAEMMSRLREDCEREGEEFLFEEQQRLVADHLRLLEEHTASSPADASNAEMVFQTTTGVVEDEDEEWSSCDDDDDGEMEM